VNFPWQINTVDRDSPLFQRTATLQAARWLQSVAHACEPFVRPLRSSRTPSDHLCVLDLAFAVRISHYFGKITKVSRISSDELEISTGSMQGKFCAPSSNQHLIEFGVSGERASARADRSIQKEKQVEHKLSHRGMCKWWVIPVGRLNSAAV